MKRLALPLGLMLLACSGCNAGEPQHLPTRALDVVAADGRTLPLEVEMATTPDQQQMGLMFRTELPDGKGMLFVFDGAARRHGFWMKNTLIPLDMLFAREGRVVGIAADAKPLDETTLDVGTPSDMVLEVPGGWAKRNGVAAGALLRLR